MRLNTFKLEALGFEWSLYNEAGWEAMRTKLAAFKAEHGNCRVLNKHPADPQLGHWVHFQRACKKKLDAGDPSRGMTAGRVAKLDALGFEWSGNKRKRGTREEAGNKRKR